MVDFLCRDSVQTGRVRINPFLWALFTEVKWLQCDLDPPPCGDGVTNTWILTSISPIHLHDIAVVATIAVLVQSPSSLALMDNSFIRLQVFKLTKNAEPFSIISSIDPKKEIGSPRRYLRHYY